MTLWRLLAMIINREAFMRKILNLLPIVFLGACVYNNAPNAERFYVGADINAVDWTRVNAKGRACETMWLWSIPVGDNSVATAVENGQIARIAYIDSDTMLALPLPMVRRCTNVYGEGILGSRRNTPEWTAADVAAANIFETVPIVDHIPRTSPVVVGTPAPLAPTRSDNVEIGSGNFIESNPYNLTGEGIFN